MLIAILSKSETLRDTEDPLSPSEPRRYKLKAIYRSPHLNDFFIPQKWNNGCEEFKFSVRRDGGAIWLQTKFKESNLYSYLRLTKCNRPRAELRASWRLGAKRHVQSGNREIPSGYPANGVGPAYRAAGAWRQSRKRPSSAATAAF